MTTTTAARPDEKIDVKVVLSSLWISMLFIFAYVDIFAFFRKDVIEGSLAGEVAGVGITINQAFLTASLVFIAIPCFMLVVSLIANRTLNRRLNIGVSLLYVVMIAVSCIGETWIYYLLGSFIEIVMLLGIARIAKAWPENPSVG